MPVMNILITGFEPFDSDTINPSAELVERLAALRFDDAAITHRVLPCAFKPLERTLREAMTGTRAELVIGFGLATGRSAISLERVAINVIDARIPDNLGDAPIDEPVVFGGPAAYFTTLPIKNALQALHEAGIPAAVSQTAGTFVCNAAFYLARHLAGTLEPKPLVGFVHVPCLPEMPAARNGAPALELDRMVQAGRLIVEACLTGNTDRRIAAGTIA